MLPHQSGGAYQTRVFISCSSSDLEMAKKLEQDLKNQRVSPWIYKKCIKPGSIWLKEIDEALADADYVLGLVTKQYIPSLGGAEAYFTIAEGLQKRNVKFIPLFFVPRAEVKSLVMKGIQGIDFTDSYDKGMLHLIQFLKTEEGESAKVTLSKVESPESPNPFRRARAEFFRDNYELLAEAFAEPEKEKYDMIQEDKSVFIFGGRGCGKSMILKSLTPRVLLYRSKAHDYDELRAKGINFFGIYSKVQKGSLLIYDYNCVIEMGFAQTGFKKDYKSYKAFLETLNSLRYLPASNIENEPVLSAGLNAVWSITLNELNLKILKTLVRELVALSEGSNIFITIGKASEQKIVKDISRELDISASDLDDFESLTKRIDAELLKIGKYVQDLSTPHAKPAVNWARTDINFLDRTLEIISENIEALKDIAFYLLIDEFENLRPIQQTIIIEWIKTAQNFVVKVASKFEGMYTNMTLQGQPLQFGQDCPYPIELDYDLLDESNKSAYQNLLVKICRNLLKIEDYKEKDIRNLLEEPKKPELPQSAIDEEIKEIRKTARLEFSTEKIEEYRNKLQTAAIFRLLRKRRRIKGRKARRKRYAGFETYTYLSSGIVRIFLNLAAMALYKAEGDGANIKNGTDIRIEHQTWAAYVVSRAWLEKIPENYDLGGQGERIYQFIVDLGDILRERLLLNPTASECLSITLVDAASLDKTEYSLLRNILSYSERESLLYKRKESSSDRPKKSGSIKGREYLLNRIHAPILGLSHRARWARHTFVASELNDLLSENHRERAKKKLLRRARGKHADESTLLGYMGDNI